MAIKFQPLDLSAPVIAYLCLGSFIVFFSMISLVAKQRLYIGEAILATGFGIIIGPHCLNILNPRDWSATLSNDITLEVMRVTLATGLFAIGVELPRAYLAKHWKSLTTMVIPTMAFGWVISAGFLFALFPGLSYISALCISACLTPTDPILSVAITSGTFAVKHVPVNIRRLIAAESAANDGLAYPFLSISIYLSVETSRRVAIGEWFLVGWLYQVILGVIIGTCLGLGFCHIMKFARRKGFIDRESYVAQYIALSLMSIGLTGLLGSDDLLAAFAAGSAISWDGDFNVQIENDIFSTVLDLVVNCAAFIYIGAWLPFEMYNVPESLQNPPQLSISPWRLVVLFLLILVFRRLPSLILLYKWVPDIDGWREALFTGHFGPMGVGAIFISTLALTRLEEPHVPPRNQQERLAASLHPIVSFVVLCSIIVHGLSIPFFKIGRTTVTLTSSFSRPTANSDWLTLIKRVKSKDQAADGTDIEGGLATPNSIRHRSVPSTPRRESALGQSTQSPLREPAPGQGLAECASSATSNVEVSLSTLDKDKSDDTFPNANGDDNVGNKKQKGHVNNETKHDSEEKVGHKEEPTSSSKTVQFRE
ncbi:hypothetical protein M422DRAFT_210391 [Sphaerobolus stellatus SS14]|uniref:Cation/H+ exchanger transmembrane domain-containing protein n=1 Tax=Sphaerobolus stellatus (strain SS14) TaxID=990650 RepID=A0A0C9U8V7_SPHS4|nr:hypothetical protein M422DRAFT_210391 [Sphaerobolus stellatus SS14]